MDPATILGIVETVADLTEKLAPLIAAGQSTLSASDLATIKANLQRAQAATQSVFAQTDDMLAKAALA